MAVICPKCGRQLDVTLFTFRKKVRCHCGHLFGLADGNRLTHEDRLRIKESEEELRRYRKLQRMCDGICLLLSSNMIPNKKIDPLIKRAKNYCEEFFPGKGWLFDIIYGKRFEKIKQKRSGSSE